MLRTKTIFKYYKLNNKLRPEAVFKLLNIFFIILKSIKLIVYFVFTLVISFDFYNILRDCLKKKMFFLQKKLLISLFKLQCIYIM